MIIPTPITSQAMVMSGLEVMGVRNGCSGLSAEDDWARGAERKYDVECGRDMNAAMRRMARYMRRVKYSGRGRAGAMARSGDYGDEMR